MLRVLSPGGTPAAALAVLAGALAVALVVPAPGATSIIGRADRVSRAVSRVRAGPALAAVVAGATTVLLLTVEGLHLVLALILLGSGVGVLVLARAARGTRAAERRRERVVEVCEVLVGELRAGQPLTTSLAHAAEVWPELAPVVAAARLDADVPSALRRIAERPGGEGLREVAAAWQVSRASGAGLAGALAQVAGSARERQGTRHLVRGELASAQATARLVALLPVASLAMSAGIGGHPWHFLLRTAPGLACLGMGLACAFAGLWWIDRIAAGVLRQ